MNNILNFKNQQPKQNDPWTMKIIIIALIVLAIIKLPQVFSGMAPLYREHGVKFFNTPESLPADFIVADLTGKASHLDSELGENMTVLAFWATWCKYWAREFPVMDNQVNKLAEQGIKIIPVAKGDEEPHKINRFFQRGNIDNMQTLIATSDDLHRAMNIRGYPSYIAVDKNGKAFATIRPDWGANNILELFRKLNERSKGQGL